MECERRDIPSSLSSISFGVISHCSGAKLYITGSSYILQKNIVKYWSSRRALYRLKFCPNGEVSAISPNAFILLLQSSTDIITPICRSSPENIFQILSSLISTIGSWMDWPSSLSILSQVDCIWFDVNESSSRSSFQCYHLSSMSLIYVVQQLVACVYTSEVCRSPRK